MPKTIDATPQWEGIYPLLEQFIRDGNSQQRDYVCDEVKKLCKIADRYNEMRKKEVVAEEGLHCPECHILLEEVQFEEEPSSHTGTIGPEGVNRDEGERATERQYLYYCPNCGYHITTSNWQPEWLILKEQLSKAILKSS